jgi:Ca2+-binding EF-hand superfamily protein
MDDNGDDGMDDNGDDQDEGGDAPTAQELINMTDTDDSGTMSFDEFIEYLNSPDPDAENGDDESLPQSVVDDISAIFDNNDADMSGDLDVNELDQFILEIEEYFMSMDDNGDGSMFTCDNGNEIPAEYVDDGDNDCGDWSDEPNHNDNGDDEMDDNGDDNHEQMWTFEREMSECDSDADGMVDYDELDACVTNDLLNDGYGDEEILDFYGGWFDWFDADGDGMLDSNEFNDFAEMTSEGPMMVCYSVNSDEVDLSITSEEYCDYANTIWTEALQPVNDGDDGMDDNGDGHDDHGDHGSMFDWMISETQDMPMEGSFDDYTITLAMCTMDDSNDDGMDMGMGTTPTMDCSDDVLSVTIADAMIQDAVVMFHDVDMSGTISQGDMVHINPDIDADGWNTVRLYSTSANSYSDENPMLTPGFTGALGMLALLGAALLTRRD